MQREDPVQLPHQCEELLVAREIGMQGDKPMQVLPNHHREELLLLEAREGSLPVHPQGGQHREHLIGQGLHHHSWILIEEETRLKEILLRHKFSMRY